MFAVKPLDLAIANGCSDEKRWDLETMADITRTTIDVYKYVTLLLVKKT